MSSRLAPAIAMEARGVKVFGRIIEFPGTGKRGRPCKPARVPDEKLSYAQSIKRHRNARPAEAER